MAEESGKRECPCCHHTNLVEGVTGRRLLAFIPKGVWMWVGYRPKNFVCLDCGFMGYYLTTADLHDLQQKQAK